MIDIMTPLKQISAMADDIAQPYAPKLSKAELRHLKHHICLAIIGAEARAARKALEKLTGAA